MQFRSYPAARWQNSLSSILSRHSVLITQSTLPRASTVVRFCFAFALILVYYLFLSDGPSYDILAAVITSSDENIRAIEATWKTYAVPEMKIEYVASPNYHHAEHGPAHPFLQSTTVGMVEGIIPKSLQTFKAQGDVMKAWLWLYSRRRENAKWFMIIWDRSYWLPGKLVSIMSRIDPTKFPVIRIVDADGQPSQWIISRNFLYDFSYRIPTCSQLVLQGWNPDHALVSCILGSHTNVLNYEPISFRGHSPNPGHFIIEAGVRCLSAIDMFEVHYLLNIINPS